MSRTLYLAGALLLACVGVAWYEFGVEGPGIWAIVYGTVMFFDVLGSDR